jgi:hypothetical protein
MLLQQKQVMLSRIFSAHQKIKLLELEKNVVVQIHENAEMFV